MNLKNLTAFLTIRVTAKFKNRFHRKAKQYGKPSEVHRELVEAFVDDRVTIEANPKKPSLEKMYEH